jgi:hypothetical protein
MVSEAMKWRTDRRDKSNVMDTEPAEEIVHRGWRLETELKDGHRCDGNGRPSEDTRSEAMGTERYSHRSECIPFAPFRILIIL